MNLFEWAILFFAAGLVLILAELLLPTHGVLGAAGLLAVIGGILVCFLIHTWLGLGVFAGCIVAAPFVFVLATRLMPKTRLGRRLVLPPVDNPLPASPVQIGQLGVTVSELRPMGICEFSDQRIEVMSEFGIIPPGTRVQVVNVDSRRPVVRPVAAGTE